jgi:hypothetical protein
MTNRPSPNSKGKLPTSRHVSSPKHTVGAPTREENLPIVGQMPQRTLAPSPRNRARADESPSGVSRAIVPTVPPMSLLRIPRIEPDPSEILWHLF